MIRNAVSLLDRCGLRDRNIVDEGFLTAEKFYYISGGEQGFIRLLNMLSYIPKDSVLLLDAPFAMLDTYTADLLLEVMRQLQIQIILTADIHHGERIKGNKIYLETNWKERYCGYPNFNYKEIFGDDMSALIHNRESVDEPPSENKAVKYILGEEADKPESRNIEYKEIKGNNACNSIVDTAEIYINAFLNSRVVGIGVIKWGISDDLIVKGVRLSKRDRDDISRRISERVGLMKPYVSADAVQVLYENILDGDEIAEDLFIVDVVVKPQTGNMLFCTAKGDVYIKTEGGKKKLDAYAMQSEYGERLKNSRYTE